jgi:hypothetical protein
LEDDFLIRAWRWERSVARRHKGAELGRVALRSFALTAAAFLMYGAILAGISFYVLRDQPARYGAVAVALALVESTIASIGLGVVGGVGAAMKHGLASLHLGQWLVRLIFERLLGITAAQEAGERTDRIAGTLEAIPLAQAEAALTSAVQGVVAADNQGGWLRRQVQTRLVELIRKLTLAKFRSEGSAQGGIDLLAVGEGLEQSIDGALEQRISRVTQLWTALVALGLPLLVGLQTWAVMLLLGTRA